MLKNSVPPSASFSDFDASMRCAMYDPPPGSAPGYQLAHQLMPMGRMKIISASSDMPKFGSMSRIGWPEPSDGDMTGCALPTPCTTCSVESLPTSSLSPSQPLASPPSRRPTSTNENQAAANTAVILMKNWIMSITSTPQSPEWAAKATLRTPVRRMVCHAGIPNRMLAILQAASVTVPMMKQLKNRPR